MLSCFALQAAACEVALSRQSATALDERVECEVSIVQSQIAIEWEALKKQDHRIALQ